MLTEANIIAALKLAGQKTLQSAAKNGTSHIRDALTARLDNDQRFQRALEHEREEILWTLHAALQATVRCVFGQELSAEQVTALLFEVASAPSTHRRFRSLLNAAVQSSDDRVAMLAVGYFVGARSTSLRERLDVALQTLFPDDAEVLGHTLELIAAAKKGRSLLVIDYPESDAHVDRWLLCAVDPEEPESMALWTSPQSLRSLERADCIALSDGVVVGSNTNLAESPPGQERHRSLEVLPLGYELHRILNTVDWRSIRAAS